MKVAHAMTVEYSRQRKQFGVPIGKFQVLQHRMVDMYTAYETSVSLTYLATIKLDAGEKERKRTASAAKVGVGQAARLIGQEAVQIHGGNGFALEYPISRVLCDARILNIFEGAAGLEVVSAGKGTKYLDGYHYVTPDDVWEHYGLTPEQAAAGGMNPQMFNSFLDGTKSAIEMAAVANATGLSPAPDGLAFPACGTHDLPHIMRPRDEGGLLHHKGQVEVISSEERDGRHVTGDLRWGVYVVFEAPSDYVRACFDEYGLLTDSSGTYSTLWKPYHLIGLELGISVASVAMRHESTGAPRSDAKPIVWAGARSPSRRRRRQVIAPTSPCGWTARARPATRRCVGRGSAATAPSRAPATGPAVYVICPSRAPVVRSGTATAAAQQTRRKATAVVRRASTAPPTTLTMATASRRRHLKKPPRPTGAYYSPRRSVRRRP